MDDICMEHSAHERAINKHDERLDSHARQLDTTAETLATLKIIEKQNQERIDALEKRVQSLETAPAQRWETAMKTALTAVVAGVVGMALATIGIQ